MPIFSNLEKIHYKLLCLATSEKNHQDISVEESDQTVGKLSIFVTKENQTIFNDVFRKIDSARKSNVIGYSRCGKRTFKNPFFHLEVGDQLVLGTSEIKIYFVNERSVRVNGEGDLESLYIVIPGSNDMHSYFEHTTVLITWLFLFGGVAMLLDMIS